MAIYQNPNPSSTLFRVIFELTWAIMLASLPTQNQSINQSQSIPNVKFEIVTSSNGCRVQLLPLLLLLLLHIWLYVCSYILTPFPHF